MKAESPLRYPVVQSAAWLICIGSHRRRPVECGLRISHTAARAPPSWFCLLAVLVCCMPSGTSADFKAELFGQPAFGGMYSTWCSSPVALGSGDYGFQGAPAYSSFFHEMGPYFTLDSPISCSYGGKIEGQAKPTGRLSNALMVTARFSDASFQRRTRRNASSA